MTLRVLRDGPCTTCKEFKHWRSSSSARYVVQSLGFFEWARRSLRKMQSDKVAIAFGPDEAPEETSKVDGKEREGEARLPKRTAQR